MSATKAGTDTTDDLAWRRMGSNVRQIADVLNSQALTWYALASKMDSGDIRSDALNVRSQC